MPGLRWFGRRWNVASDDFVVAGLVMGALHLTVCIVLSVFYESCFNHDLSKCQDHAQRQAHMLSDIAAHFIAAVFYVTLSWHSNKGFIFDLSQRKHVPACLSAVMARGVCGIGVWVWGVVLLTNSSSTDCESCVVPLSISSVVVQALLSAYPFAMLLLSYDAVGNKPGLSENAYPHEQYETVWFRRCWWICCCIRSKSTDGNDREAFQNAASTLAKIFRNVDLVPSDIAAGMTLLRAKQYEKRLLLSGKTHGGQTIDDIATHAMSEADLTHLNLLITNSKHYMAAYGSLIFWWTHLFSGPCRLLALAGCGCTSRNFRFKALGEGCCRFDSTAVLRTTGLRDNEILIAWFGSKVCVPGFYVAAPREGNDIIIAVRGTLSLQDCVTDAFATPTPYAVRGVEGDTYVHAGMLKAASNILQILQEERILDALIKTYSTRRIVVLGHSLGAGVATILTLVLREEIESFRERTIGLAYSPPGGLLSRNLSAFTESFIYAVLLGKDVIPRLSTVTMEEFRNNMVHCMAQSQRSKTAVMCTCCHKDANAYYFKKDAMPSAEASVVGDHLLHGRQSPDSSTLRLYPPTNILHLIPVHGPKENKGKKFRAMRMDLEMLQEIVVSPAMIADHMPDRVLHALNNV